MKKKKLIIGNWKLNPVTVRDAVALAAKIDRYPRHEAVICPPAVFLPAVKYPRLGAQDCFWESKGAYTGAVSPLTLKSFKVQYCLVGHSERRAIGETDEQVNLKIKALLAQKITPVLCVGFGTTVEQDDLEVIDTLKYQLQAGLKGVDEKKVVVAYEPVWAISKGDSRHHRAATPEHAERIALFIKTKFGADRVIYGGSANIANARGFLEQRNIDGLLPGGSSLLSNDFNEIINLELRSKN
jgi:triosephosphate isomerase (TIM)